MDINGTHFQLLLGYDDWARCSDHTKDEQGQGPLIPVAPLPRPTNDSSQEAWILLGYGEPTTCPEGQTRLRQQWEQEPVNANVSGAAVEWDHVRQEISLTSKLFLFTNPNAKATQFVFEQRRGASSDRYGNWYWIDETRSEIRVNSVGTGTTSHFWSADDLVEPATHVAKGAFQAIMSTPVPVPYSLSGLTVTEHHYLVVGVVQPQRGLLIFDLHSSGAPHQLFWPPDLAFEPFDITAMPGGGVCILDRTNKRYWRLDRQFNIVKELQSTPSPDQKDIFQPKNGGSPRLTTVAYTRPISVNDAVALPLANPVAIEALPDCSILILDNTTGNDFSDIYRYLDGQQMSVASLNVITSVLEGKTGFSLIGYDFAFVPEHTADDGTLEIPDLLFVVSTRGEQAFVFHPYLKDGELQLQPTTHYFPMRLFGGKGLATFCEQVYYEFAESWLPLISQARRRYEKLAILYTPIADSTPPAAGTKPASSGNAFDGHVPDCAWHRLLLDACIPPETSIQISSRAANSQEELARAIWQAEPALYLRRDGSELPYMPKSRTKDRGTWELLFQNARGRYLQLRLVLQGNERSTPRISALRAYYPRFSYLEHYLPATYREDRQSASFLDRYLANLEGFYTSIEDKIAAIQVLFDAYSAPPEMLDWLAGWFAVLLVPGWDEQRKRLFIRHAMDFFQYRGTIRGLQMALRLVLDSCADESIFTDLSSSTSHIRIIEKYKTRKTPGILFGDTTDLSGVRLVSPKDRWTPEQGGAVLNHLYTQDTRPDDQGTLLFPIADPGDNTSTAWQQFSQRRLGFVPSITTANPTLWYNFLARRYQTIKAYNDAYLTNIHSFEDITLPTQLPRDGKPLLDWYQFESVVLSMRNTAHRFVVLLPVPRSETANIEKYQQRYALAKRIIIQEKPTQTQFDIRFYWTAFRVAEARLGEDSILDSGSRVPPLILGQNYIGESTLAANYPQTISDRQIVSRDALGR
jgi:phage tail-like protein